MSIGVIASKSEVFASSLPTVALFASPAIGAFDVDAHAILLVIIEVSVEILPRAPALKPMRTFRTIVYAMRSEMYAAIR